MNNTTINSVSVIGAGAIGGYIIYSLADVLGENLSVIAEGDRAERLKNDGITVNGRHFDLNVKTPEEAYGSDLIILCTKESGLDSGIDAISRACGENTAVMSLMNGVDTEDKIAEKIGEKHLVYSLIRIASERDGQGINFNPPSPSMGIYFGEKDNSHSERVNAISELFERGNIVWHVPENILYEIWLKYALNISMNIPQAILGVGIGACTVSENVAFIRDALRSEVIKVAAAKGIDISKRDPAIYLEGTGTPLDARYSTLQDLDAKRKTEIDLFCGALVKMGQELNVPTPYNELALHIIHSLEEKNEGEFNFPG